MSNAAPVAMTHELAEKIIKAFIGHGATLFHCEDAQELITRYEQARAASRPLTIMKFCLSLLEGESDAVTSRVRIMLLALIVPTAAEPTPLLPGIHACVKSANARKPYVPKRSTYDLTTAEGVRQLGEASRAERERNERTNYEPVVGRTAEEAQYHRRKRGDLLVKGSRSGLTNAQIDKRNIVQSRRLEAQHAHEFAVRLSDEREAAGLFAVSRTIVLKLAAERITDDNHATRDRARQLRSAAIANLPHHLTEGYEPLTPQFLVEHTKRTVNLWRGSADLLSSCENVLETLSSGDGNLLSVTTKMELAVAKAKCGQSVVCES